MTRPLLSAAAGFLILAGALLLISSTYKPGGVESERVSAQSRTVDGLAELQRAQRALSDRNYGELSEHLANAQHAMTDVLQTLGGHPDRN